MQVIQTYINVIPAACPAKLQRSGKAGIHMERKYTKQILDQIEDDGYKQSCSSQSGFSPIFVIAGVILVGVIISVAFMFFGQGRLNDAQNNALVVPPGIVVDENGNICETQDPRFCHESVDIETWKDDELP